MIYKVSYSAIYKSEVYFFTYEDAKNYVKEVLDYFSEKKIYISNILIEEIE